MRIQSLLEPPPLWVSAHAPQSDIALYSQCSLVRNFSDFPFPDCCAGEERLAVERRVLEALDGLNMLSSGVYYSLTELEPLERQFLAECQYITGSLLRGHGARGVYVAHDRQFCVMVNGTNHLCLRTMLPGLQLEEAWAQLNLIDDMLAGVLDFAFDERRGFLSAELDTMGTGLKAGVLMHLPALEASGQIEHWSKRFDKGPQDLHGAALSSPHELAGPGLPPDQCLLSEMEGAVRCASADSAGHLHVLVNAAALGQPEAEIVFHVREAAQQLAEAERKLRGELLQGNPMAFEDRVGRARGLAGGVRLLEYAEAVELLSALRLGVERRIETGISLEQIDRLLLCSQPGHLALIDGASPETTHARRADLFRATLKTA